jgi:hypothetical protein
VSGALEGVARFRIRQATKIPALTDAKSCSPHDDMIEPNDKKKGRNMKGPPGGGPFY